MARRAGCWFAASLLVLVCVALLNGCGRAAPRSSLPAPVGSQLPHLTQTVAGEPLLSWVEPAGDGHRLAFAVLRNGTWSAPRTVATGRDWFVNWADVPSVTPLDERLWAAHWLVRRPGGMYAYDIAISTSVDGGATWREPFRPHDDDTPTEHGFASLWPARAPDGTTAVGAAWLDGRHMLLDTASATAQEPRMALRSASFDAAGVTLQAAEVDGRVCECCHTAAAITPGGVAVAYRDRSADEQRDIATATLSEDAWQEDGLVAPDGWRISGCPVNGPALAAQGAALAIAWFTDAAGDRRVRVARREAAAEPWAAAVDVSRGTLGRADVVWLDAETVAVSWMAETSAGAAEILLARVGRAGRVGAPVVVASTTATRAAGFPRLMRHGDTLLVAWTRWRQDPVQPQVVVTQLPADALPAVP